METMEQSNAYEHHKLIWWLPGNKDQRIVLSNSDEMKMDEKNEIINKSIKLNLDMNLNHHPSLGGYGGEGGLSTCKEKPQTLDSKP